MQINFNSLTGIKFMCYSTRSLAFIHFSLITHQNFLYMEIQYYRMQTGANT
jgi:hypothetical protein